MSILMLLYKGFFENGILHSKKMDFCSDKRPLLRLNKCDSAVSVLYSRVFGQMIEKLNVTVKGQGLHMITSEVARLVQNAVTPEGLCTLFIRHTSASLLIQENADPSARRDLESWLNRLVPENDPLYTHTMEGADDMPAHIKSALTATALSIPFAAGRLLLGTWQGIYLWEHRHYAGRRELVVHLGP